ncbi:MAG: hypothetical protein HKM93_01595 [Desulfobacteraceae bacterium]|nr:hypothetical protein [Desulfobacteraceae bacterium]
MGIWICFGNVIWVDETTDPRGPLVQLEGMNLQVVNGEGSAARANALGKLIVGYDEANYEAEISRCSGGRYADQSICENIGATWSHTHKSGSHYLVTGAQNNYSQYGGLVAGFQNFTTSSYSHRHRWIRQHRHRRL